MPRANGQRLPIATNSWSLVSASAQVHSFDPSIDILTRVDLSKDGKFLEFNGSFDGGAIVTLNGVRVPLGISYSATTGLPMGQVSTENIGRGPMNLVLCSGGQCSTRGVYINK